VRILSDADGQLQVVLVGQLELRERLQRPEMRQLDQRVSVHCQLQPLDIAGVAGYISHRLHVAGGSSDRVRFTGEAVEAIYLLSGGVPRVINRLCDRALRYGYSKREATIDADIVQSANPENAEREPPFVTPPMAPPPTVAAPVAPPPAAVVAIPAPVLPAAPPVVAAPPPTVVAPPPVNAVALPISAAPPPAPAPPPVSEPVRMIAPAPPMERERAVESDAREPLPDHVEKWLSEIETQPAVDLDWRQRWAATNAVAAPPLERRTGVRLKIPASQPQRYTHVDRVRRRMARRFFWGAVSLVLLLGGLVLGPASVDASLDILSQIDEQLTPPAAPTLPVAPRHAAPAWPRVVPPADPLGSAPPLR